MRQPRIQNPIRGFAVLTVAVISLYIMWIGWTLIDILSSPDWCSKALQAERISAQNFGGLTACNNLLEIQLRSLATNSHILFGVVALCLLTLIVIVIAGGRLSLSASKTGVNANIGKDDVGQAAQAVADEAQEAADGFKAAGPKTTANVESASAGLPEALR